MPLRKKEAETLESVVKQLGDGIDSLLSMVDRGLSGKPLETPREVASEPPVRTNGFDKIDVPKKDTSSSTAAKKRRNPHFAHNRDLWARLHHDTTVSQSRAVQSHAAHARAELRSESVKVPSKKKSMSPTGVKRRATTPAHVLQREKAVSKSASTTATASPPPPSPLSSPPATLVAARNGAVFSKHRSASADPAERVRSHTAVHPSSVTVNRTNTFKTGDLRSNSFELLSLRPSAAPTISPASRSLSHPTGNGTTSPPPPAKVLDRPAQPASTLATRRPAPPPSIGGVHSSSAAHIARQRTPTAPAREGRSQDTPVKLSPKRSSPTPAERKAVEAEAVPAPAAVAAPAPAPRKKPVLPKLSLGSVMEKKKTDPSFTYESFLTQTTGEEDIRAAPIVHIPMKKKEEAAVEEAAAAPAAAPAATLDETMTTASSSLGNTVVEETRVPNGDGLPPPSYEDATSVPTPSKPKVVLPRLSLGGVLEKKKADPSFTYEKYLTQVTGEEDIRAAHVVEIPAKKQ